MSVAMPGGSAVPRLLGIPLAATLTGGNRNDVTQLIRGKPGQPLRRPKHLYADRGYDHESYRDQVRRF